MGVFQVFSESFPFTVFISHLSRSKSGLPLRPAPIPVPADLHERPENLYLNLHYPPLLLGDGGLQVANVLAHCKKEE